MDRLIGLVISVSVYWPRGRGFDSRHFHNFKCGLDLERVHPASWGQLGSYLMENWRIWLRKSKLIDLTERNGNHIIPLYCHRPVSCRSLVDRCGSLGSCKPQIYFLKFNNYYSAKIEFWVCCLSINWWNESFNADTSLSPLGWKFK